MKKKRCASCENVKPFSAFSRNKATKTGRASWCKVCRAEWKRIRYKPSNNSKWQRYYVIYDPIDSFTKTSSFTKSEIVDMLHNEYLAIGTRFRSGANEYRVNNNLCLKKEME